LKPNSTEMAVFPGYPSIEQLITDNSNVKWYGALKKYDGNNYYPGITLYESEKSSGLIVKSCMTNQYALFKSPYHFFHYRKHNPGSYLEIIKEGCRKIFFELVFTEACLNLAGIEFNAFIDLVISFYLHTLHSSYGIDIVNSVKHKRSVGYESGTTIVSHRISVIDNIAINSQQLTQFINELRDKVLVMYNYQELSTYDILQPVKDNYPIIGSMVHGAKFDYLSEIKLLAAGSNRIINCQPPVIPEFMTLFNSVDKENMLTQDYWDFKNSLITDFGIGAKIFKPPDVVSILVPNVSLGGNPSVVNTTVRKPIPQNLQYTLTDLIKAMGDKIKDFDIGECSNHWIDLIPKQKYFCHTCKEDHLPEDKHNPALYLHGPQHRIHYICYKHATKEDNGTVTAPDEVLGELYPDNTMKYLTNKYRKIQDPEKKLTNNIKLRPAQKKIYTPLLNPDTCPEVNDTFDITKYSRFLLRSAMGTGKSILITILMNRHFQGKTMLWMTSRVAFGSGLLGVLDQCKIPYIFYRDINWSITKPEDLKGKCLIIQMESLAKIHDFVKAGLYSPEFVIKDESESCSFQFSSKTMTRVDECSDVYASIISDAKYVIYADAHLGTRSINTLVALTSDIRKILHVINEYKPSPRTAIRLKYVDFYSLALQLIKEGKRIIMVWGSKSKMLRFESYLIERKIKYIMYHNKTDMTEKTKLRNVNEEWAKYDVVMYTCTITVGISYTNETRPFDYLFLHGSACGAVPRDLIQATMRARKLKENTIYYTLDEFYGLKDEDEDDERPDIKDWDKFFNTSTFEHLLPVIMTQINLLFKDLRQNDKGQYVPNLPDDWLIELIVSNYAEQHQGKRYFACILERMLKEENYTIQDDREETKEIPRPSILDPNSGGIKYLEIKPINTQECTLLCDKVKSSTATAMEQAQIDRYLFEQMFKSTTDPVFDQKIRCMIYNQIVLDTQNRKHLQNLFFEINRNTIDDEYKKLLYGLNLNVVTSIAKIKVVDLLLQYFIDAGFNKTGIKRSIDEYTFTQQEQDRIIKEFINPNKILIANTYEIINVNNRIPGQLLPRVLHGILNDWNGMTAEIPKSKGNKNGRPSKDEVVLTGKLVIRRTAKLNVELIWKNLKAKPKIIN
jgi:hypothetical protein